MSKKFLKVFVIVTAILVALIILVIVRLQFATVELVLDGGAMEPTIHKGQTVTTEYYKSDELPQRGDIVEYSSTNKLVSKYSKSGRLAHRIIALLGERITVKNKQVLVYNQQQPNGFNPDGPYIASNVITPGDVDVTLEKNVYFVMGDNRPDALDSRAIGPVALSDIIAKIKL